jgi:hypothetical protein
MDNRGMDKLTKQKWLKIISDYEKKRRLMPVRKNQIALWIGRLVIEHNNLENLLASTITALLVDLIADDKTKVQTELGEISTALKRAKDFGLQEMFMASMSFKQKLDLFTALLFQKFPKSKKQQDHIKLVVGQMSEADTYRNGIAHSFLEPNYTFYARVKVNTKGFKGLKIQRHTFDIPQIKEVIMIIQFLQEVGMITALNDTYAEMFGNEKYEIVKQRFEKYKTATLLKPKNAD